MARLSSKQAKEGVDERAVFYETLDEMGSRLEVLTQRVVRVEERLESLASQVVALESRVHEDVE